MYEYFVKDSGSRILITTSEYEKKMRILSEKMRLPLVVIEENIWKQELISNDTVGSSESIVPFFLLPVL